ncbi:N-acetylmuramidase family protein [Acinetobacter sp. 1124_18A]
MSNKLTESQIIQQAESLGVEPATLQVLIDVECKGSGFNQNGTSVILFELYVIRQRLTANNKAKIADEMIRKRPDLCSKTPAATAYILNSMQSLMIELNITALESCSWGVGLVWGVTGIH